jgi:acetylornithine/succinyldiaminopimelate/putrescine aminotransferase
MEREDVPGRATRAGARLTAALEALPQIALVRGLGLLLAAELEPGLDAKVVADAALAAGLVVNAVTPTSLRLAPPLLVSDDEIDEGVALLAGVLDAVAEDGAPDGEPAAADSKGGGA